MAKTKSDPPWHGKALELWQPPDGAGDPLLCIATTFTFNATFFETECLGRFLQMDSHPQESDAVGYLIEREEKLAGARVSVLVDRRHAVTKESLRWDVLPVLVPGAILHAKIAVLCWANHVRVIIGSGNLTEPGYRQNVELFASLDLSRPAGGPTAHVVRVLDFLRQVLDRTLGNEERQGPKRRAREIVDKIQTHFTSWNDRSDDYRHIVPVFTGSGSSLFAQLHELWPSSGAVRTALILSPFFDAESTDSALVADLNRCLAKKRPRDVQLYIPSEAQPDGRTRLFAPRSLVNEIGQSSDVAVFKVTREQDGEVRPLHAKSIVLQSDTWELTLIGSSNFTRAGCGATGLVNLEANLAYLVRSDDGDRTHIRYAWPEFDQDDVDLDSDMLIWAPAAEGEEGENDVVPLPGAFREALFEAGSDPKLILLLDDGLPPRWIIKAPGGNVVLSSHDSGNRTGEYQINWAGRPVPFLLDVSWTRDDLEYAADWPVNVSEPALLSPPDALRDLTLEELVEVLASTRPLHIAVVQVLQKRRGQPKRDIELDPHKRVNTETFLLRRTKRVAQALEQLRLRLERPAINADGFDWRLRGPVGALALANAMTKDARSANEARFFLAELALALHRVRPDETARGGLSADVIREQLRSCIAEIEVLARSKSDSRETALDRYIEATFVAVRA